MDALQQHSSKINLNIKTSLYAQLRLEFYNFAYSTQQKGYTSTALRNFCRQRKARNWIIYEWAYSQIDTPLLLNKNEFQRMLAQDFQHKRGDLLTRTEWQLIRAQKFRRPRRFSANFIDKERARLKQNRQICRELQIAQNRTYLNRTLLTRMSRNMPYIIPKDNSVLCLFYQSEKRSLCVLRGRVCDFHCQSNALTLYTIELELNSGQKKHLLRCKVNDYDIIAQNQYKWLMLQGPHRLGSMPALPTPQRLLNTHEMRLRFKYMDNMIVTEHIIKCKRTVVESMAALRQCMEIQMQTSISPRQSQGTDSGLPLPLKMDYAQRVLTLSALNDSLREHLVELEKFKCVLSLNDYQANPRMELTSYVECKTLAVGIVTGICQRLNVQTITNKYSQTMTILMELATALVILTRVSKDPHGCTLNYCLNKLRSLVSGENLEAFDQILLLFKRIQIVLRQLEELKAKRREMEMENEEKNKKCKQNEEN